MRIEPVELTGAETELWSFLSGPARWLDGKAEAQVKLIGLLLERDAIPEVRRRVVWDLEYAETHRRTVRDSWLSD